MAESGNQTVVSVIIPCYKRAELAKAAVESVIHQDLEPSCFEILVVDSSPDDSVINAVEELGAFARCHFEILRKKPEGPGPSRNLGASRAKGQILVFFDSDCKAAPGWLRALVDAFATGIGIVQGRTLPNPEQRQGIFSHTLRIEQESFLYETANIAYRREAFEQVGGFKADWNPHAITPLGGEDVDLAWRVKRLGWKSTFASNALIYHEVLVMKLKDWIWISRRQLFPSLVGEFPELRQFFFRKYFFDPAQAWFTLGVLGLISMIASKWLIILILPYLFYRASGATRSLRGPLRLLRPLAYLPQDGATFLILLNASVRSRSLLL